MRGHFLEIWRLAICQALKAGTQQVTTGSSEKSGAFYIAVGELWYAILAPIAVAIAVYLVGLLVYGMYHLIKKIASPKKATSEATAEEKTHAEI